MHQPSLLGVHCITPVQHTSHQTATSGGRLVIPNNSLAHRHHERVLAREEVHHLVTHIAGYTQQSTQACPMEGVEGWHAVYLEWGGGDNVHSTPHRTPEQQNGFGKALKQSEAGAGVTPLFGLEVGQ